MFLGVALTIVPAWTQATDGLPCYATGKSFCLDSEIWRNLAAGGSAGTHTRYYYDADGNRRARETVNNPYGTGAVEGSIRYDYTGGRLTRQTQLLGAGLLGVDTLSVVDYEYGDGGNMTGATTRAGGKILYKDILVYDGAHGPLRETRRLINDSLIFSHRFGYDGSGRVIVDSLLEWQGSDIVVAQRVISSYDSAGRPAADTSYRSQGGQWYLVNTVVRAYKDGLLASVAKYEKDARDRRLMDSVAYAYDASGNRIREEGFDDEASPQYSIEYRWVYPGMRVADRPPRGDFRLLRTPEGFRVEGGAAGPVDVLLCDARGAARRRISLPADREFRLPDGQGHAPLLVVVIQDARRLVFQLIP